MWDYLFSMKKYLVASALFLSLLLVATTSAYYFGLFASNQSPLKSLELASAYDVTKGQAEFNGRSIAVPGDTGERGYTGDRLATVLGDSSAEKRIEVDLSKQTLYAYEGDKLVYEFLVSTGLWGRTPTGEFRIWAKPKFTLMTGGNRAWGTYYYLPNVPFVQFFYNDQVSKYKGFSLHGTYWHNNFGHPMSHGCVNMYTPDAEKLFYWTSPSYNDGGWATYSSAEDPGTRIIIYGAAPL